MAACSNRYAWIVLLTVIVAAAVPKNAVAQTDKPSVLVVVDIQADLYTQELGDDIAGLNTDASQVLAERLGDFDTIDYVEWITDSGAETRAVLKMVIEGEAKAMGTEIRARIGYVIGTSERDPVRENATFHPVVFGPLDQKFAQSRGNLLNALTDWIDEHINESFSAELHAEFLEHVPLTSDVRINGTTRTLVIPIRYASLGADRDTRLKARFRSTQVGVDAEGEISLEAKGSMTLPEYPNQVLNCAITRFEYDPLRIESRTDIESRWSEVEAVLDESSRTHFSVFMEEYIKNYYPGADDDGVVTDLPS